MSLKFVKNPTKNHIIQIKSWLIDEYQQHQEGFYVNWNVIEEGFYEKKLYCLTENNKAIGFVWWRAIGKTVKIEIAEIKRKRRKLGLGRLLVEYVLREFKISYLVVNLACAPSTSEPFWQKMGFKKYYSSLKRPTKMYQLLVDCLPTTNRIELMMNPIIELWDDENSMTLRDLPPTWKWEIFFEEDTNNLTKPIICPIENNELKIRYRKGEKIFRKSILKRFSENEICFGDFLIIEELVLIV